VIAAASVVSSPDPVPQPGRQHLFQLGQRPHRCLPDALHRVAGGRGQADGDGHGLVVIQ